MALICDKCKKPVKVTKDFRATGLDLCDTCSVLFDDALEKTIENFTDETKSKNKLAGLFGFN